MKRSVIHKIDKNKPLFLKARLNTCFKPYSLKQRREDRLVGEGGSSVNDNVFTVNIVLKSGK